MTLPAPRVVADSAPLIALARIGEFDLLRTLFRPLAVPQAVRREVVDRGRGRPGARELAEADWIETRAVAEASGPEGRRLREGLGPGEAEALALCLEIGARLLLIDDEDGRLRAERSGLRTLGAVGVLAVARRRGLISDLESRFRALREAGFYTSADVEERARRLAARRP